MTRTPARRAWKLVVTALAFVVLGGCTRDSGVSVGDTTTSAATSTTTSTSTSTTSTTSTTVAPVEDSTTLAPTTPAPTPAPTPPATEPPTTPAPTTAPPASGCAALPAIPAGIVESASELIDVDADGLADTVRTYAASATPGAGDWHVRVELANGGGIDLALAIDPAPGAVRVLGATYVGSTVEPGPGGARPVIFVTTGAGASASIVTLFRFDACNLVTMTAGGAAEASFPVGGGVTHAENLRCEGVAGASLLVYQTIQLNADGVTFDVTDTPYSRTANDLTVFGSGPVVTNQPTMPAVATLIDCPNVDHP